MKAHRAPRCTSPRPMPVVIPRESKERARFDFITYERARIRAKLLEPSGPLPGPFCPGVRHVLSTATQADVRSRTEQAGFRRGRCGKGPANGYSADVPVRPYP